MYLNTERKREHQCHIIKEEWHAFISLTFLRKGTRKLPIISLDLPKGTEKQKINSFTISWESSSQEKISREGKHTHEIFQV